MPHPLTEEHLANINKGLAAVKDGREQLALAKQAGIDTGEAEQKLNDAERSLVAIKQVYFPGRM
jgi:hypothetical protein